MSGILQRKLSKRWEVATWILVLVSVGFIMWLLFSADFIGWGLIVLCIEVLLYASFAAIYAMPYEHAAYRELAEFKAWKMQQKNTQ